MSNPLTERAKTNLRNETRLNYLIAASAGIIIGSMLALAI